MQTIIFCLEGAALFICLYIIVLYFFFLSSYREKISAGFSPIFKYTCLLRWHNHLNPAINKEAWTEEEDLALMHAHQIHGNKWAELTKFLPGRYYTFF